MRKTWFVRLACGAVLAACNSSPTGNGNGCQSTGGVIVTASDNHTFTPQTVQINQGQSVCFQNNGTLLHSITPDSLIPDDSTWLQVGEQSLPPNLPVTILIGGVGRDYYYHCKFHGGKQTGMYGRIRVR